MKKVWGFVLGGIENKIFNLVLITTVLIMGAFMAATLLQTNSLNQLVAETNQRQQESIKKVSSETINSIINGNMTTMTEMEAYMADDLFKDVKAKVRMLGEYATNLYRNAGQYTDDEVHPPDPNVHGIASVQLLYADDADRDDPKLQKEIGLIANMGDMMNVLFRSSEQLNSCFIATASGIVIICDDRAADKYSDNGKLMTVPTKTRPWYIGAEETGKLFFTDADLDLFTGESGLVCSLPIYSNGKMVAVVGADLFLDSIEASIDARTDENGSFFCIVNQDGRIIFSPQTEGSFRVPDEGQVTNQAQSEESELVTFMKEALTETTEVEMHEVDGREYYLAGAPMPTVGWAVVSVVDKDMTDKPTRLMMQNYSAISAGAEETYEQMIRGARQTIVSLIVVIFLLSLVGALFLGRRIVEPLGLITEKVGRMMENNLQFKMEDSFKTKDEVQVLAEAFAEMSRKTVLYLEEIREATAEKERIGAELSMASAIQDSQLPSVFPPYPDRHEFDLYASMTPAKEVGGDFYDFFLIDDDHIGLVIADVSGKGVPAALFMMLAKSLLKNRLRSGESPGSALANVNDQLLEGNEAGMFVTVWVSVLTISTGEGIAANAGHEHPVLRRANGLYELVKYRHSLALAAMEGVPFREHSFKLEPGDSLFVYTDGVAEATNEENELFGTERMLEALNKHADAFPEETLKNVMNGIHGFVAGAEQFDDITMLCLKYYGHKG